MLSRRNLLAATPLLSLGLLGCTPPTNQTGPATPTNEAEKPMNSNSDRIFGAEWEPHRKTYMSWPNKQIWRKDLPYVRDDIAKLARAIAEFERS